MEIIKNWIISVCSASVVTSVSKLIFNESKIQKTVNIFLSLFLLFYMIAPFNKESDYNASVSKINAENAEKQNTDYSLFIETAVNNVCKECGCSAVDIDIRKKEVSGETVYTEVNVRIDDISKSEEIKSKIKQQFGFEVNIS